MSERTRRRGARNDRLGPRERQNLGVGVARPLCWIRQLGWSRTSGSSAKAGSTRRPRGGGGHLVLVGDEPVDLRLELPDRGAVLPGDREGGCHRILTRLPSPGRAHLI